MKITLLCNAGLALEYDGAVLLVDVPNDNSKPFYRLPDEVWHEICEMKKPYDKICGLYFTHDHPDHLDRGRLAAYPDKNIPVYIPDPSVSSGELQMGPFCVRYTAMDHAPIPNAPAHVVTLISAGGKTIYIAADAVLDCDLHRQILRGERVDAAFWNSMFLSGEKTRILLNEVAEKNYIYHMPLRTQNTAVWRKCDKMMERFGDELTNVCVLEQYPVAFEI